MGVCLRHDDGASWPLIRSACTSSPACLQSALRLPVDPTSSVAPEVLVLLAMLVILRATTYLVLRRKTAATQPAVHK